MSQKSSLPQVIRFVSEALMPDTELDRNRKAQQALKVRKAQIKAQQAQQQLRVAQAPTAP